MAGRFQKGSSSFYEKDYPKIPIPNEPPSLDGLFSAANSPTLNEIFLIDHYFIKTYSQRERNLLRSNILSREIKLSKSPVKKEISTIDWISEEFYLRPRLDFIKFLAKSLTLVPEGGKFSRGGGKCFSREE